jgi:aminoglycoside/choline kinase family phosphotransferase
MLLLLGDPLGLYGMPYLIIKGESVLVSAVVDARQQQLEQWLSSQYGQGVSGVPASSDASFRRYFRYQLGGQSLVAMDAPPQTEDCRPFVQIARMLDKAGVAVPEILAEDLERGFLLLSDLGRETYLQVMLADDFDILRADALFSRAIESLLLMQQIDAQTILPAYDESLLRRELMLFPDWYLQRHLSIDLALNGDLKILLDDLFDNLIAQVLAQGQCFVHRDFMPRNLMIGNSDVAAAGVLDFQDAVYGPVSYDPICLFKDAFISWPEADVERWLKQYWQQACVLGLPVPDVFEDFYRDCDYMGVHRHLKVIGIFARICHRDGKAHYLEDVPRFFAYLKTVAQRRPELSALSQVLAKLEELI